MIPLLCLFKVELTANLPGRSVPVLFSDWDFLFGFPMYFEWENCGLDLNRSLGEQKWKETEQWWQSSLGRNSNSSQA